MKKYLLLVLSVFLLTCTQNKLEVDEKITATVITKSAGCIAVRYDLAGLMVLDDICGLKLAQIEHLSNHKTLELRLHIKALESEGNCGGCDEGVHFHYYLGATKLGERSKEPIPMEILIELAPKLNTIWLVKDGVHHNKSQIDSQKKSKGLEKLQ